MHSLGKKITRLCIYLNISCEDGVGGVLNTHVRSKQKSFVLEMITQKRISGHILQQNRLQTARRPCSSEATLTHSIHPLDAGHQCGLLLASVPGEEAYFVPKYNIPVCTKEKIHSLQLFRDIKTIFPTKCVD